LNPIYTYIHTYIHTRTEIAHARDGGMFKDEDRKSVLVVCLNETFKLLFK